MSKVTVDDRSSRIKYTGYWEQGTDRNVTVNSAWDPGSQAIFSFKGTHVAVFGVIPDGDGEVVRVDFSVDNATAVSQTRQSGSQRVFNEQWWESDTLAEADHTLVMTYQRVNNADMDFRLDFIEYTTSSSSTESTSALTTGTESSTPSSTTTSNGSSGESSGTGSSKSQAPIGGIVGGVLGGMLIIVLAALTWLLVRRRRRRAQIAKDEPPLSPYAVPSQGAPSAISTTKPQPQMAQNAPAPESAPNSGSVAGAAFSVGSTSKLGRYPDAQGSPTLTATAYGTSDSGLSYQTGPASERHPPDIPPPAYDSHSHVV
ncbi:hypothetical protein FA13DRAFT_1723584 [Coprinellus micaceus]|uniref:Uncharacterized protein n=1 Tax=Coprinellus micaceus TaxID=71717 RepID=A0A4Y7TZH5_COPMI|nr:hypothetical protein FA13DRAFT_1723584 [Coprinellus micaceus]